MELVMSHIENRNNVFLTGKAGTGKSYIVNKLKQMYPNQTVCLAPTGLAAANVGGETIHKFFKLGISNSIEELQNFDNSRSTRYDQFETILKRTKILFIDEISMVSGDLLSLIYYRLEKAGLIGRLIVVLIGDFYQLSPVKGNYCFESDMWKQLNFKTVELTKIWRTDEKDFIEALNDIRLGGCSEKTKNFIDSLSNNEITLKPTVLYSTNEEVRRENYQHLDSIDSPPVIFKTEYKDFTGRSSKDEITKYFSDNMRIDEYLALKVGARVMCLMNHPNTNEIYNGLTGKVLKIEQNLITMESDGGLICQFSKKTFEKTEYTTSGAKVLMSAVQFPLIIAAALTVHKAQGMTLNCLEIDAKRFFLPTQFYVSLSRASNSKNLVVKNFDTCKITPNERVNKFYESIAS